NPLADVRSDGNQGNLGRSRPGRPLSPPVNSVQLTAKLRAVGRAAAGFTSSSCARSLARAGLKAGPATTNAATPPVPASAKGTCKRKERIAVAYAASPK